MLNFTTIANIWKHIIQEPQYCKCAAGKLFAGVYFSSTNIEQKICKFLQTYTIFAIATLLLYCLNVADSKQSEVEYIKT